MIEIYNNFELIGVNPVYSEFTWTRRFSRSGEFRLVTSFTTEYFEKLAEGNVLYKRDVDEAGIIERRQVISTIKGDLALVVEGRHLSIMLDRRVFSLQGDMPLNQAINNIINNNFMAPAGNLRSMEVDGLRFMPHNIPTVNISIESRNMNSYSQIVNLCEENGLGFKIRYNLRNRTYDLMFLNPTETDVAFSKEFGNIVEQNYMDDKQPYKNVVIIEDQHIHNNTVFTGINRREVAISAPREGQSHFTQSALDALHENRAIKILSSTVNPYSQQFLYLQDWDIGSIVLTRNRELDFSKREVISEIVEIYGEEGLSLVVNMGDHIERRR